jgi:hypothetical protein
LRSAAAWIERHVGVPAQTTRERLRVADRLAHLPVVAEAFASGRLCYSKVRAIAVAWSTDTADALARDEAMIVGRAAGLTVRDVVWLMGFWKTCAQPDGTPSDLDRQWEARRAYLSATLDGVHHLHAVLDAEGGGEVAAVLDDIDQGLWTADHHAARAATDGAVELIRSPAQRRADALVEMARRAATSEGGRRARPLVRAVGGDHVAGGVALDLGEARNLSGPLRHLVQARDRTCCFPGCTIRSPRCDVHHVVAHHDGGPTRLGNLLSLCAHHHRLLHEGGFRAEQGSGDNAITFTRPDGSHLAAVDLGLRLPSAA